MSENKRNIVYKYELINVYLKSITEVRNDNRLSSLNMMVKRLLCQENYKIQ